MLQGDLELNELERSVLYKIAVEYPKLKSCLTKLKVVSREFSGMGSFTGFEPIEQDFGLGNQVLGLDNHTMTISNLTSGMGAILFCSHGKPDMLELYTFGEEWNGGEMKFTIEPDT